MGWSACSLVPRSLEVSLIVPTLSLVQCTYVHIYALCNTSTGANNSRVQSCTSPWIAARLVGGVWRFITQGRNVIRPLPVCTLRPSPHLKYLSSLLPLLKVLCFLRCLTRLRCFAWEFVCLQKLNRLKELISSLNSREDAFLFILAKESFFLSNLTLSWYLRPSTQEEKRVVSGIWDRACHFLHSLSVYIFLS